MNETPPSEPLTQGWPDEPDRAEMETFARQLAAGLPTLPDVAIGRIEQQVQHALAEEFRQRRRQRILVLSGIAAGLLAIAGSVWFFVSEEPKDKPAPLSKPAIEAARLHDVFPVAALPEPKPSLPESPLIRLDEYRSLFKN